MALAGWGAGCDDDGSTSEIAVIRHFDLSRYLGVWYEVARMPHRFEWKMDRVTAHYFQTSDGSIRVENKGFRGDREYTARGIIRQVRPDSGDLEVSFFRPFYGSYRIVALDDDYSMALVISRNRDLAWILVRDPRLAATAIARYRPLLEKWGFDCGKLEYPELPSPFQERNPSKKIVFPPETG